jgi:hypothetical protein
MDNYWICFRPQVKVEEKTPTQFDPLERANPVIEILHKICIEIGTLT